MHKAMRKKDTLTHALARKVWVLIAFEWASGSTLSPLLYSSRSASSFAPFRAFYFLFACGETFSANKFRVLALISGLCFRMREGDAL